MAAIRPWDNNNSNQSLIEKNKDTIVFEPLLSILLLSAN